MTRSRGTRCCPPSGPTCCDGQDARPRRRLAYREAIEVARTDAERRFLTRRLTEVGGH